MNASGFVTFSIIPHTQIDTSLDLAIKNTLTICFPHEREHYSSNRTWRSEPAWVLVGLTHDGCVAAHMAIVERTVTVGDAKAQVQVFGPQSVCVLPDMRKHGLVEGMMVEASVHATEAGIAFGLLFAREGLREKVYSPLGWRALDVRVFVESDTGGAELRTRPSIPMVLELSDTPFPDGDIYLNGLDW